jgi:putative ABC transport system permease protein
VNGLFATLRRRPVSVVGVLVALIVAAAMATVTACLAGTGATLRAPVERLAASPVVVVGDQHVRFTTGKGDSQDTTSLALTAYRRVPVSLADRLSGLPGVTGVVADLSVPLNLTTGTGGGQDVSAHGWSSAALAPYKLTAGHAPSGARQVVLTSTVAAELRTGVGQAVRLNGSDQAPLTVAGVVTGPGGALATAFVSDAEARTLYGHPGEADLLAVLGPGSSAAALGAQARQVIGSDAVVLTGAKRGLAEDVDAAGDKDNVTMFAFSGGIPVLVIALFVVAGAVGLSLSGRRRDIALLRAVGATPGQIRRRVARELAGLGLLGGLIGYPFGLWIARLAVDGLVRHDLVPAGTTRWDAGWVLGAAAGAGLIVAELSGLVASWRAGRTDPVLALREAATDSRRPPLVRTLFGLICLGGGVALSILTFHQSGNPTNELNLALFTLLSFIAALALLGPTLVSLAELALRLPLRLLGGAPARLALADMRGRSRRIASAVVSVGLSVGFLGTVYLVNTTGIHADEHQAEQRLVAQSVLSAPPGLPVAAVAAAAASPGVSAALGTTATTAYLPVDGGTQVAAEALTPGSIPDVLRLGVVAGNLDQIRPGEIAVSQLGGGNAKVGSTMRVYLADGAAYQARVVAIYQQGLGFGDAVLPLDAAGGGHLGSDRIDQILVRGTLDPTALQARYPGLKDQGQTQVNAQAHKLDEESQYLNTLIVLLIGLLASIALVNTLITATLERRAELRLVERVGASWRQLMAMAGWQALTVSGVGLLAGVLSGAVALVAVTKALTGRWQPYLPVGPAVALGVGIVALTGLAVLAPTAAILRHRRGTG